MQKGRGVDIMHEPAQGFFSGGSMHIVRRLLKSVGEYKKESVLSPVFMSLEVLLECVLPLFTSSLLNTIQSFSALSDFESEGIINSIRVAMLRFAGGDAMTSVLLHGGVLAVCAALSLVFGALSGRTAARASAGAGKNLRRDVFYNIQNFSFANIDKFSAPGLVTRLTTDVGYVRMAYMALIRTAVRAPLLLVISMIMSFQISVTISLITLGFMAVIVSIGLFIFSKVMPIYGRVFKKYDKLNESVQENIKGMRVVKAYVREEFEKAKFDKASADIRDDYAKAGKILACADPMVSLVMYLIMLTVVFVGAFIIMGEISPLGDRIQIGELTSLINYSMQILGSIMMLTMVMVMCGMAVQSSRRLYEVLEEKSDIVSPPGACAEVPDGRIEFRCVSFKYSDKATRNALDRVSLSIRSGESIGIIGGTGSAKTTLIQLIPRLYDATEGEVLVGGRNVKDYDLVALRDAVAAVPQKSALFSGTIRENLLWGDANATDADLERVARLASALSFVSSFPDGFDTRIEQGGANVSGGQRQRLCIARALLKNPKVIILDDSTSAVDTRTDAEIRRSFREELPETTKIIIAQRIRSVMDCDRILVLDGGRVADFGTHSELMARCGIYYEVYSSQIEGEARYAE